MSSTLKYKKVYIDTKYATPDSNSTSDFSIELPETFYFDNASSVFYVDDICICHSWYTVEKDLNDCLYLYMFDSTFTVKLSFIVKLTPGNYTGPDIALEIQTQLNDATTSNLDFSTPFTCLYSPKTNTITLSLRVINYAFNILTPKDLKTGLGGLFKAPYDIAHPHDCNELISNLEKDSYSYDMNHPFKSGSINLQPIRNIYLHSSALGCLNNIGPDGSQTVIKKIPVTADFNNYIFDQTVLYNDYNSCSGQTLKKLDFQFKTSRGEIIPLHGVGVSLSIIFARENPDA